jgi:hypothetical protein
MRIPGRVAAAFDAHQNLTDVSLSPDGSHVAYVGPTTAMGSSLFTIDIAKGEKAHLALVTSASIIRWRQDRALQPQSCLRHRA